MSEKMVPCELCKKLQIVSKMFVHRQYQCEKRPGAAQPRAYRGQ